MKARRGWAWPLVPLYAAGLAVKDGLRAVGILRTRRLGWPVVSVGSLSAGGAGKTPVVIALAELLQARGWSADVLSRGYGRSGEGVDRVDVDAKDAARQFGDEPVLIARRTGVDVWVGADRYEAGRAAEAPIDQETEAGSSAALRNDKQKNRQRQEQQPEQKQEQWQKQQPEQEQWQEQEQEQKQKQEQRRRVHLLDDGFQHRGLARAVDVVLVTAGDLEDALLPAGNRREGLRAVGRADVVVVRDEERESVVPRLRSYMRGDAVVWNTRREMSFPGIAPVLNTDIPTYGHVVFSAIARPENFVRMLSELGVNALEVVTFADHHPYTESDIDRLVGIFETFAGNGFVTTEKDAVKLTAEMMERLQQAGPVCVAKLGAGFLDEAAVVRELEARIG